MTKKEVTLEPRKVFKFEDLSWLPHTVGKGYHATCDYPNGYGLSIVCGEFFYCSPRENLAFVSEYDTYEVAIMKDGDISYDSGLTSDVLGYQTKKEVEELMRKVSEL